MKRTLPIAILMLFAMATISRAGLLEDLQPGRTTRDDCRAVFGEPVTGKGGQVEAYDARAHGFSTMEVTFDDQGIVTQAWGALASPVSADDYAERLGLGADFSYAQVQTNDSPMEETRIWPKDGVKLIILDGLVRKIGLSVPERQRSGSANAAVAQAQAGVDLADEQISKLNALLQELEKTKEALKKERIAWENERFALLKERKLWEEERKQREKRQAMNGAGVSLPARSDEREYPPYTGELRSLMLGSISAKHGEWIGDTEGVVVRSVIALDGLEPRDLVVSASFRDKLGKKLLAPEGAPPSYIGAGGTLEVRSGGKGLKGLPGGEKIALFFPYKYLDWPADENVIVRLTAECSGLSARAERELMPSPGPREEVLERFFAELNRSLRLDGVSLADNVTRGDRSGVVVGGNLKSDGMEGEELTAEVRMRYTTGDPVKAIGIDRWEFADRSRRLAARETDTVRFAASSWRPFEVFIPWSVLDLERGETSRVVISFEASCGDLSTMMEREFEVSPPR